MGNVSTPSRIRRAIRIPAAVVTVIALLAVPARATFPGANGKLVFSRQGRIFTMDPDGTDKSRLTGTGSDYSPAWSSDGDSIAFVRYSDARSSIWVMNADGSARIRVSNYGRGFVQPPIWSPNGMWIAYWDAVDTAEGLTGAIWRVTPDGQERLRLTSYASVNAVRGWSPDSAELAVESDRDGDSDVWVMNADGSGKTKLTQNTVNDFGPQFAPDGSRIVFYRNIPRGHGGGDKGTALWTMDPDGTDPLQLTDGSRFDLFPKWSPTGSWIGFRGDTFSQQTGSIVELYRIAPDGTQLKKLTGPETLTLAFNWSPDSTKIVFVDKNRAIDVIEADGTGLQTLATDPVSLGLPDWQALP